MNVDSNDCKCGKHRSTWDVCDYALVCRDIVLWLWPFEDIIMVQLDKAWNLFVKFCVLECEMLANSAWDVLTNAYARLNEVIILWN